MIENICLEDNMAAATEHRTQACKRLHHRPASEGISKQIQLQQQHRSAACMGDHRYGTFTPHRSQPIVLQYAPGWKTQELRRSCHEESKRPTQIWLNSQTLKSSSESPETQLRTLNNCQSQSTSRLTTARVNNSLSTSSRSMSACPDTARPMRHVSPITVPRRFRMALMRCSVPATPDSSSRGWRMLYPPSSIQQQ